MLIVMFIHYIILLAHYLIYIFDHESLEKCVTTNFACEMLVDKMSPGIAIVKECGSSQNRQPNLRMVKYNAKFQKLLMKLRQMQRSELNENQVEEAKGEN